MTWIHHKACIEQLLGFFFFFLQPMELERWNLQDDEQWAHWPITSIIQKSMCEQLLPGSLDRDHTETDNTMIDVISPLHAFCKDQGILK